MIAADRSTAELAAQYPDLFRSSHAGRLKALAVAIAAIALFFFGCWYMEISIHRLVTGFKQLGWFIMLMIPPDPGTSFPTYLHAMGETLSIAFLGTLLAALLALPVSLLAAKNIIPSVFLRFPVRRFLDSIRGVDTLIWALVWINVVGLGPFAGVLAIATSDFGAFGKLFSEAIEGADRKQVEGIRAAGGNKLHEIRFGLSAAGAAGACRPNPLFHRVQHAFRHHHRHRRRRRHRPATRRTDPRAGMAEGLDAGVDDLWLRWPRSISFRAGCALRSSAGQAKPGTNIITSSR